MNKYIAKTSLLIELIIIDLLKCDSGESIDDRKQFFYYSILFKTIHTLEGAISLLKDIERKPFFQLSFVLILRTIISDLITAEFVATKELKQPEKVDDLIERIEYDHYKFTKSNLGVRKILFGENENSRLEEAQFLQDEIRYHDQNGSLKTHLKKRLGTFDMIKYIASNTELDKKYYIQALSDRFEVFSKIAHFGGLTMIFINEYFSESNTDKSKLTIEESIGLVFEFCIGLLNKVKDEEQEINPEITLIFKQIQELKLST